MSNPETDEIFSNLTFEDVERVANEFTHIAIQTPDRILVMDDTLFGFIKEFQCSTLGLVQARRYAVRLDERDIKSPLSFEEIRQAHIEEVRE